MSDHARLQEVHTEIHVMKTRKKELNTMQKDELAQHQRYQEIKEEMDALKVEKKAIETQIREQAPSEAQELDELKIEIKSTEELLSDLAMNLIMQNESVELVDEKMNRYVPTLHVKFKKDGTMEEDVKE